MEVVASEIEARASGREARLDFRVRARELAESRQKPALQELARHAEVEHAPNSLAPQSLDGSPQLVEAPPHARQELRSVLRQRDRTGVTTEQRHADVGLQRLDLSADGRRRHSELAGRGREAQVRRHGFENAQSVQGEAVRIAAHPLVSCKISIDNKSRKAF
jgi:hypothetical protein